MLIPTAGIFCCSRQAVHPGRAASLRPGGLIAFSTEELESAACPFSGERLGERERGKAYHLQRSGRFAHQKTYVLDALAAHGFSSGRRDVINGRGREGRSGEEEEHGGEEGDGNAAAYFHYERAPIRTESVITISGHYVIAQRL